MKRDSLKQHLSEGPITYDFTLHDVGRGLGTTFGHFSFRLLQFHGHGTWLMCEVALNHSFIHCVAGFLAFFIKQQSHQ
jgi:hypothetical protein